MINIDIQYTLPKSNFKLAIAMQIEQPSIVALSGVSGVGKTTFFRIIAGLTPHVTGTISVGNTLFLDSDKNINLIPQKRAVALLFQDYALYPNMTVLEQLKFANPDGDTKLIAELINVMQLEELSHQLPKTLSGGQQQRLALARTLAQKSAIILLDEPFSALDQKNIKRIKAYIKAYCQRYKPTLIFTSHIENDWDMADARFQINNGQIFKTELSQKRNSVVKVHQIIANESQCYATTLINGQLVRILISKQEASSLKKGSWLTITLE